jgi:hypothetical protein
MPDRPDVRAFTPHSVAQRRKWRESIAKWRERREAWRRDWQQWVSEAVEPEWLTLAPANAGLP